MHPPAKLPPYPGQNNIGHLPQIKSVPVPELETGEGGFTFLGEVWPKRKKSKVPGGKCVFDGLAADLRGKRV